MMPCLSRRVLCHVVLFLVAAIVSPTTFLAASARAELTLGHRLLLKKGLQLKAMASMFPGFDAKLFQACGFTTIDLGLSIRYDDYQAQGLLPGGAKALDFCNWVRDSGSAKVCSDVYLPNLISVQLSDEQSIESDALPVMVAKVAALKAKYPNTIVYTNQTPYHNNNFAGCLRILTDYIKAVQPDMLSFTEYPFCFQGTGCNDYVGGSPYWMYNHIEMYRRAGLAGLDGTGSKPIPVSMYVQTYAHTEKSPDGRIKYNGRMPTESEFRLQQFAGWAAGMKSIDAFRYTNKDAIVDSLFFKGTAPSSQIPTAQYYQYKKLNQESAHLGESLVRLISTDFFLKMGRHEALGTPSNGAAPTSRENLVPSGVTAWTPSAGSATDPYLTGMTATNAGSCNNGLPGDVVLGYLKPLDASLAAKGSENDIYFMVVNGLTDGTASAAAACRQTIHMTFNFRGTAIGGIQRKRREDGKVEEVPLTALDSPGCFSLTLTLDGGTGDLFKYNTGSKFISKRTSRHGVASPRAVND